MITTGIEHQAVLGTCRWLSTLGCRTSIVPAGSDGIVGPAAVEAAIAPDTVLISIMLANNETGVLQPVHEISALAHQRGIALHSDAVQALGKIPVDVRELEVDLLSVSAHKLCGPKGVGALFVKRGTQLRPLLHGGHHEAGRRAGTENLPAIAGFGKACQLAGARLGATMAEVRRLRDALEQGVLQAVPGARVNGHLERRLPNTSNISFPGRDSADLLLNLDLLGIAVSTGAACSAESQLPSQVLLAMGISPEDARSALRFSLGHENSSAEIERVIQAVRAVATGRP